MHKELTNDTGKSLVIESLGHLYFCGYLFIDLMTNDLITIYLPGKSKVL